jgi:hypothetical protein
MANSDMRNGWFWIQRTTMFVVATGANLSTLFIGFDQPWLNLPVVALLSYASGRMFHRKTGTAWRTDLVWAVGLSFVGPIALILVMAETYGWVEMFGLV